MQRLITSSLPTYQSPLSCFLRTSVAKDTRIFLRQCLNIMGPLALGIALDQHALLHPDTIGISIPKETKQEFYLPKSFISYRLILDHFTKR